MSRLVTRFAPSPTGRLHLGHAFSALTAWNIAENAGGKFELRIEDIDTGRSRPEFEAAILEDLAWLGLRWPKPLWRQSARLAAYATALERLKVTGLVYPCTCSRRDIAAALWTIAGAWKYLEYPEVNTAGSYLFEPAGSIHTLVVPETNTEVTDVWFAIYGANLNLAEDGSVDLVIDAQLVLDFYLMLCAQQGIDDPPVIGA